MIVRDARSRDLDTLSDLALRSKGHWGYDEGFLRACAAELTVTARMLEEHTVRVAEESGAVVGFYGLLYPGGHRADRAGSARWGPDPGRRRRGAEAPASAEVPEVEHFFVEPRRIGKGIGRALWEDLLEEARRRGHGRVRIASDPFAEPFYLRMGARRVGDVASGSIEGRRLPLLEAPVR